MNSLYYFLWDVKECALFVFHLTLNMKVAKGPWSVFLDQFSAGLEGGATLPKAYALRIVVLFTVRTIAQSMFFIYIYIILFLYRTAGKFLSGFCIIMVHNLLARLLLKILLKYVFQTVTQLRDIYEPLLFLGFFWDFRIFGWTSCYCGKIQWMQ